MCIYLIPEHASDKSLDSPFLPRDLAFLIQVMVFFVCFFFKFSVFHSIFNPAATGT